MGQKASVTWLTHKTAAGLPEFCAFQLPPNGPTVLLRRGMRCYYLADELGDPNVFNFEHGVSRNQSLAMFAGMVNGWHAPEADPARYDGKGHFIAGEGKSHAK